MKFYRIHLMGHETQILGFLPGFTPDIAVLTRSPALIGSIPALPESALYEGRAETGAIYGWSAIFSIDSDALTYKQVVAEMEHRRIPKPFTGSPEQILELGWDEAMQGAARQAVAVRKPGSIRELRVVTRKIVGGMTPEEAWNGGDEDIPF